MVTYYNNKWPAYEMWKQAIRKRQKLIFNPHYKRAMRDECMMAVVFGYTVPLKEKILLYSLPSEYESVMNLFSGKVEIAFTNGNLVISNLRKNKNKRLH
jgi:hypothetical protein